MKKKYFFFLSLILVFCSCNKTETSNIHPDVDVYIVGTGTINTIPPTGVARYWKNNMTFNLPSSSVGYLGQVSESASGITMSGNDLYICGTGLAGRNFTSGANYIAKYWKNGISVNLTDGSTIAQATSIAASGTDVYVAGIETTSDLRRTIGKYWKNGVEVLFFSDSARYVYPTSIGVSGTDVYVSGTLPDTAVGKLIAMYWKNGVPVRVSDGSADAQANSIVLDGSDIYVAGNDGNRAVYWKNQVPVYLTDGVMPASARSIAISGNDVCVAGNIGTLAKYWKNEIPATVGDSTYLSGIAVAGGNVYVIGNDHHQFQTSYSAYWINNMPAMIFDTRSYSTTSGILVIPH
ncbi:MAG: hypothetical protein ACHQET_09395 [Chitinophagales bacterium]